MSRARDDLWSRRRAAVAAEEAADRQAEEAARIAAERAALEQRDDAEILSELNLPDPDDLTLGDDVRGFMARAVPERLRQRALRRLWRLNPVLANVDGLVDYGEDFTDATCVVENLQSAYQVGKGMLAHVEEMARQAEAEAGAEAESDAETDTNVAETPGPAPVPEPETDTGEVAALTASEPESPAPETGDEQMAGLSEEIPAPAPRRMRFEFEE